MKPVRNQCDKRKNIDYFTVEPAKEIILNQDQSTKRESFIHINVSTKVARRGKTQKLQFTFQC